MIPWVAIAGAVAIIFIPSEAYAWGLVTHLQLGRDLIGNFREFLQVYAPAILQFPLIFHYGTVAPDRFLAKNLKAYREHTHNWDRAFLMLKHAGTDDLTAFALGYLSHLAADVVAHNHFVPMKILEQPSMRGRRHSWWELKFEHYQPKEAWDLAEVVDQTVDKHLYDSFMEAYQSPSLLSFEANMALTDRFFRAMGSGVTRRWVSRLENNSPTALLKDEVTVYMDLARDCILSVVEERERSFATAADPRGGSRISHARMLSKAVVRSANRGLPRSLKRHYGQEMSSLLEDAATVLPVDTAKRPANAKAYERLLEDPRLVPQAGTQIPKRRK
jgi:hypothetical protein